MNPLRIGFSTDAACLYNLVTQSYHSNRQITIAKCTRNPGGSTTEIELPPPISAPLIKGVNVITEIAKPGTQYDLFVYAEVHKKRERFSCDAHRSSNPKYPPSIKVRYKQNATDAEWHSILGSFYTVLRREVLHIEGRVQKIPPTAE